MARARSQFTHDRSAYKHTTTQKHIHFYLLHSSMFAHGFNCHTFGKLSKKRCASPTLQKSLISCSKCAGRYECLPFMESCRTHTHDTLAHKFISFALIPSLIVGASEEKIEFFSLLHSVGWLGFWRARDLYVCVAALFKYEMNLISTNDTRHKWQTSEQ